MDEQNPYAVPRAKLKTAGVSPIADDPTSAGAVAAALRVRPWVRYFARMLDIMLFGALLGVGIEVALPGVLDHANDLLINAIVLGAWVFAEALLLASFGTTPGKALLGTRLIYTGGLRFGYGVALARSALVWWRGLGAGLPLITLITMIVGYNTLKRERRASWDADAGFIVQHRPLTVGGIAGYLAIMAGIVGLIMVGVLLDPEF
jgi:hypothetical protein